MGVVACRVQEVRLAQSGLAPDEQGVVGPRRRLGNRQSRGVSEPIRGTDDEGVKCVAPVEAGAGGVRRGAVGPFGEVGRPVLVCAGEGFAVFIDLVDVGVFVTMR